jgi:hypothetical protein
MPKTRVKSGVKKLQTSNEWDQLTAAHSKFEFAAHADAMDPGFDCQQWIRQYFRPRVWMAIAVWSNVPLNQLTSATPLGGISPGPWGPGQQISLVQLTNQGGVFDPFPSKMAAPPTVAPPSTTISQWERAVWTLQTPKTPCWGPYPI